MKSYYWTVAAGALAIGLGHTATAFAQDEAGADSGGGGNDIVVTARRVEERLQDVPISITVYSQEAISNRNVVTAADLAAYTPSLAVNQRWGPEKAVFAIRGFTQDQNTAPSVGVYFADVVAPRAYGGTTGGSNVPVGSFMDLQNVQVLKGPQGTLFGRNTTGGAVLVVPQKPTDRLEGNIEGTGGNYGMWRAQGVLNVPLADTFKVRLAVDRNHRDGYMINHSGKGPTDYNDVDYFAARLSIVADLTPDIENYTIATYSRSSTNGYGLKIIDCNLAGAGAAALNGRAACDQVNRQAARGDGPYDVDINAPDAHTKLNVWAVINTTTWKVSDNLTVKNIVSYQEYREKFTNNLTSDNWISNFGPTGALAALNGRGYQYIYSGEKAGRNYAAQSTFTEELQLQGGTSDGNLVWQAGAYLENANPIGYNTSFTAVFLNCGPGQIGNTTCAQPLPVSVGASYSDTENKYWYYGRGLYAQSTYKFTEQLSITAGIRYTWDKVKALSQPTRLTLNAAGGFLRECGDVTRFRNPNATSTANVRLVVTSREQCRDDHFQNKSGEPTWMIDLDYKPIPDVLIYAKYSRGYRAGSLNLTAFGLETWDPEKVEAYEIGAKTSFNAGAARGYFNIAGFYNDLSNQQILARAIPDTVNFPGVNPLNPVVNAGKSKIQGIEVDAAVTLFDSLKLDVGYTYLDTKLKDILLPAVGAPYLRLESITGAGGPLTYSPKHRLTLGGTYTLPLPEDVGEISLGLNYVFTDTQLISSSTIAKYQFLPKSNVFNANVNWDNVAGQPFDLAFFVTNLTNKVYPLFYSASYNSSGLETAQYAPPRMWGVRARYRFGQ